MHAARLLRTVVVRGLAAAALVTSGTLALVAVTVAAPVPPSAPAADPEQAGVGLQQALDCYRDWRPLVPGVALSVTAPARGLSFAGAAGRRSLFGPPLTVSDPFRSASVTKTFTAAALLRLAETGRLGLDDPIAEHLPADLIDRLHVRDGISSGHLITVRQLLNHTAGLYDYATDPGWMARVALSPGKHWEPHELLDAALTLGTPYAPPGAHFHYSDTGYVLLALIIERVTAQPLPAAYRGLLPMHLLPATHLEGREPAPALPIVAEYAGPLNLTRYDPSFDTAGGGGLVTTAADLDTFTRALFGGRVFTDPDTLAQMLTTVPAGRGGAYGLGIGRRTIAGADVWLHTGFSGAFLAYVPELDLSIAGSTNQTLAAPDPLIAATITTVRGQRGRNPAHRGRALLSAIKPAEAPTGSARSA